MEQTLDHGYNAHVTPFMDGASKTMTQKRTEHQILRWCADGEIERATGSPDDILEILWSDSYTLKSCQRQYSWYNPERHDRESTMKPAGVKPIFVEPSEGLCTYHFLYFENRRSPDSYLAVLTTVHCDSDDGTWSISAILDEALRTFHLFPESQDETEGDSSVSQWPLVRHCPLIGIDGHRSSQASIDERLHCPFLSSAKSLEYTSIAELQRHCTAHFKIVIETKMREASLMPYGLPRDPSTGDDCPHSLCTKCPARTRDSKCHPGLTSVDKLPQEGESAQAASSDTTRRPAVAYILIWIVILDGLVRQTLLKTIPRTSMSLFLLLFAPRVAAGPDTKSHHKLMPPSTMTNIGCSPWISTLERFEELVRLVSRLAFFLSPILRNLRDLIKKLHSSTPLSLPHSNRPSIRPLSQLSWAPRPSLCSPMPAKMTPTSHMLWLSVRFSPRLRLRFLGAGSRPWYSYIYSGGA